MSWTGGYSMSSAIDIARFWTDLFGHKTLVSAESAEMMKRVDPLNSKIGYHYGFGTMSGAIGDSHFHKSEIGKYIGHDGLTYGFGSS
jgi:hypothetical protein